MSDTITVPDNIKDVIFSLYEDLILDLDLSALNIDIDSEAYRLPWNPHESDIYRDITKPSDNALTERVVDGNGSFDRIMTSIKAHLKEEYDNNRITGPEYTKAYIALTEAALATGLEFVLQKDKSYWDQIIAQAQAINARIAADKARMELAIAKVQAELAKAQYALTKTQIATSASEYTASKYNTEEMLPKQKELVEQQINQAIAQTKDTLPDGSTVAGFIGKQKELTDMQIEAYTKDSQIKAAKVFSDAWAVIRTTDEDTIPPTGFTKDPIDTVLTAIKNANDLV